MRQLYSCIYMYIHCPELAHVTGRGILEMEVLPPKHS